MRRRFRTRRGSLRLGRWAEQRIHFTSRDVPAFAGISGGRTSAMMAALLDVDANLLFYNTGREHPKTYDFLQELDEALGYRLVLLEWRPPRRKGAPPREFGFAQVQHATLDKSGGPFEGVLQALADFRATKGEEPISPWARGRLCTAYLKHKVQQHYIQSLGVEDFDSFVGLRHDEPERIAKLKARATKTCFYRTPLADAGIRKEDVLEFWRWQAFDLDVREEQGNCTACFLKDESDLARVLAEPETDAPWWEGLSETYRNFGGQKFPGYAQLRLEAPVRLSIEASLRAGREPENDGSIDDRRFKLVARQERLRLQSRSSFSCSCESAEALADASPEEEEAFLLKRSAT